LTRQSACSAPVPLPPPVREATPFQPPSDLDARVHAWQATFDRRYLWPTLDEGERIRAVAAIGRAVASLLRHGTSTPSLGAADGRDAYAFGVAAHTSGTGPLLGYWIEKGKLDVSEPLARILAEHLDHGRRRAKRIERELLPTLDLFQRHGIACTVLKGFHTARRYFPEPGTRPIADVDLLIAPSEIKRAERLLRDAGFVAGGRTRTPYKRDWHPSSMDRRLRSVELTHELSPWDIELHASLDRRFETSSIFRLADTEAMHEPWSVRGRPLRVLAQPLLFAMLAAHASDALHSMRLSRLIELVFVLRAERHTSALDWRAFDALFARRRDARFVYPALALAERLVPGIIDQRTLSAAHRASTRLARHLVKRMTPADESPIGRASLAEKFMWVAGPREAMFRVARLAFPLTGSPSDMRAAFGRRLHFFTRGKISLLAATEKKPPTAVIER
jgi:Uncharacterised nucleotidyltransferase